MDRKRFLRAHLISDVYSGNTSLVLQELQTKIHRGVSCHYSQNQQKFCRVSQLWWEPVSVSKSHSLIWHRHTDVDDQNELKSKQEGLDPKQSGRGCHCGRIIIDRFELKERPAADVHGNIGAYRFPPPACQDRFLITKVSVGGMRSDVGYQCQPSAA